MQEIAHDSQSDFEASETSFDSKNSHFDEESSSENDSNNSENCSEESIKSIEDSTTQNPSFHLNESILNETQSCPPCIETEIPNETEKDENPQESFHSPPDLSLSSNGSLSSLVDLNSSKDQEIPKRPLSKRPLCNSKFSFKK